MSTVLKRSYSFLIWSSIHWERIALMMTHFYLRQGIRLHTGNSFTDEYVAYTILRLKRSPDFSTMFDTIFSAVTVIDKYTIDIHYIHTNPLFLNIMTYVYPMDKTFYKGHDEIIKVSKNFVSKPDSDGVRFDEDGGFVILKRQCDAERDGDNILAVICGSTMNHDGARHNGIIAPSVHA